MFSVIQYMCWLRNKKNESYFVHLLLIEYLWQLRNKNENRWEWKDRHTDGVS